MVGKAPAGADLAVERPMSAFRIREAEVRDLSGLLNLIRALADYEQLTHLCVSSEADLRSALFGDLEMPSSADCGGVNPSISPREAPFTPRSHCHAFVAETTQAPFELVGFALWFHNYSTFLGRRGLYLEDLFVLPSFRRLGVGRALLQRLAQTAVALGCGRFEWTVLDWNAPAIDFYQSLGAQVLPDWRVVRMTGDGLRAFAESASQQDRYKQQG